MVGQVVGLVQDGVQVSAGDVQASGGDHGTGKSQEHIGQHVSRGDGDPGGGGLELLDVHLGALGTLHAVIHLLLDQESTRSTLASITSRQVLQVGIHVGLRESLTVLGRGLVVGVLAGLELREVVEDVLGIGVSGHLGHSIILVLERENVQGHGVVHGAVHVDVSQLAVGRGDEVLDLAVQGAGGGTVGDESHVLLRSHLVSGRHTQRKVRRGKFLDGGDGSHVLGLDLIGDELEVRLLK